MCRLRMLVIAALALFTPRVAAAHGDALPLIAFWNPSTSPFPASAVACQRTLGQTRQSCLSTALRLGAACRRDRLANRPCSLDAIESQLAGSKQTTTAAINAACTDQEARTIRFLNLSEAITDKNFVCSRVAEASFALSYAPAVAAAWQLDAAAAECVIEVAELTTKHLERVSRHETRTLDRIAMHSAPPSVVNASINRANARLGRWRGEVVRMMQQRCPQFASLYGRSATDLILQIELQAHCAVGAGYIQNAFACPRGFLPR